MPTTRGWGHAFDLGEGPEPLTLGCIEQERKDGRLHNEFMEMDFEVYRFDLERDTYLLPLLAYLAFIAGLLAFIHPCPHTSLDHNPTVTSTCYTNPSAITAFLPTLRPSSKIKKIKTEPLCVILI